MNAEVLEITVFVLLLAGAIGLGAYLGERNARAFWPPTRGTGSPPREQLDDDDLDDWFRDLWWTR